MRGKLFGFTSQLEATRWRSKVECTAIRKETSNATPVSYLTTYQFCRILALRVLQSKLSSFSSELEAAGQRTEVKCTAIRKEVSKALQDQRQQLIAQSESMARRMDAVALKVSSGLFHRSPCPWFPCLLLCVLSLCQTLTLTLMIFGRLM